jgi:hypothetical protein
MLSEMQSRFPVTDWAKAVRWAGPASPFARSAD